MSNSTSTDRFACRSTYRLFDAAGKKLSTAVTHKGAIFQVAPEKKSFPSLEAWKVEHPSSTTFTENYKAAKVSEPDVFCPYSKATTASLRHLAEYRFQFPGKNLFVMNPHSMSLVKIHYQCWFPKAFAHKRNSDNSLEFIEFTSFTEIGIPSETPNLWIEEELEGIREVELPMYTPAPGQKEAFILVAGRNTSVLAAQKLKKKLEEIGVLVHYGFYEKHTTFKNQIWMGSPNVFKVSQMLVKVGEKLEYVPLVTHMRERPWRTDIHVESVEKAVELVK